MSNELVSMGVYYFGETKLAIKVSDDGIEEDDSCIWLPKSQIHYDRKAEYGELIDIEMPEWLAIEKELV